MLTRSSRRDNKESSDFHSTSSPQMTPLGNYYRFVWNADGSIMSKKQMIDERVIHGLCMTCPLNPMKCFEIIPKKKKKNKKKNGKRQSHSDKNGSNNDGRFEKIPLTIEGCVYQGICLACFPEFNPVPIMMLTTTTTATTTTKNTERSGILREKTKHAKKKTSLDDHQKKNIVGTDSYTQRHHVQGTDYISSRVKVARILPVIEEI